VKHQVLGQAGGGRRIAAVFDLGDSVLDELQRLCEREGIAAAAVSGIGGYREATLAYYDMEDKRYQPIEVKEQVEVLSFLGNVTEYEGKPKLHVHCILGRRAGSTIGGHLLHATVRPTLELSIEEYPQVLRRSARPEIGIPLIDL